MTPRFTDLLKTKKFVLSAEVVAPAGDSDLASSLAQIETLKKAGADLLAVTKSAGGARRTHTLLTARAVIERFGLACVAHLIARDLLPEEIEREIVQYSRFGIRNILALRGDPPEGDEGWTARPGSHKYAYQLVEQIRARHDICIGVGCYPDQPKKKERVDYLARKVEAGAEFAITQMIFDVESYARFQDETKHLGIPILPATRVLRSKAQARKTIERFNVRIPDALLKTFSETDSDEAGLEATLKMAERLRSLGAPGLQIFVISDTALAAKAIQRLKGK